MSSSCTLVYYWRELKTEGLEELWMKAGVGNSTRFIPIHILSLRIGPSLCKVLPTIHTLTGCNYTSEIGTKLAALTANPETHLDEFDLMINGLEQVIDKAEAYVTQVLKKGTTLKSLDQL